MKICSFTFVSLTVFFSVVSPSAFSLQAQEKAVPEKKQAAPLNVSPAQAEKILSKDKKIVVLDVRTPKEYAASHIAGATNLDFYSPEFEKQLSALDKDKSYLVHCAVGGRSAKARDKMQQMNFKSIYHLEGGIKEWEKEGKPVEK